MSTQFPGKSSPSSSLTSPTATFPGPADEESSNDEDADMEEIRKRKVSRLGYMLFNVR